jgi:hypothetical protein
MLAVANAALDEVDLSGDAAGALERLVHATWWLILRSGSLLVAAEKALPAVTVRQARAGGLEERVRSFIATSEAGRRDVPPTEWKLRDSWCCPSVPSPVCVARTG